MFRWMKSSLQFFFEKTQSKYLVSSDELSVVLRTSCALRVRVVVTENQKVKKRRFTIFFDFSGKLYVSVLSFKLVVGCRFRKKGSCKWQPHY